MGFVVGSKQLRLPSRRIGHHHLRPITPQFISFIISSLLFLPLRASMVPQMSSSASTPNLRDWILQQHQSFRRAFDARDLKDWVVCVGNEAGDLDTLASSIAFAYFSSLLDPSTTGTPTRHYIPIQQTKSTDFFLRPENIKVLQLVNLWDPSRHQPRLELICSDRIDLSRLTPYGAKYALLDHNRINSALFGTSAQVVALIDHHQPEADNQLYRSADPRLIQVPTGSCASLVTNHFSPTLSSSKIPTEIIDLILSAIAIDTAHFKTEDRGGKATEADLMAHHWLLNRSRFSPTELKALSGPSTLKEHYRELSRLKDDVSSFNSAELLRRDYKQSDINRWKLGITSVPIVLESWLKTKHDDDWYGFLDVMKQHAIDNELDIASALTSRLKDRQADLALDQSQRGRRLIIMVIGAKPNPTFDLLQAEDEKLSQSGQGLGLSTLRVKGQDSIDRWLAKNDANVRIYNVASTTGTRKQVTPVFTLAINRLDHKL